VSVMQHASRCAGIKIPNLTITSLSKVAVMSVNEDGEIVPVEELVKKPASPL